jgi:hypothetical protein
MKNKQESHDCDSPDHQGASISLIISVQGEGRHPIFNEELMKIEQAIGKGSSEGCQCCP